MKAKEKLLHGGIVADASIIEAPTSTKEISKCILQKNGHSDILE